MIHVALECKHFLIEDPKEFDNKLPDLDILEIHSYCPTCKKYIKIESVGSIRKEILNSTISPFAIKELKIQQPHLTRAQCLYILKRRRERS